MANSPSMPVGAADFCKTMISLVCSPLHKLLLEAAIVK